ncbi:tRNA dihydrouridine(20/20a) synthase DusA [Halioxenophilus sp. WMMB6]|uniref:tRNA dihydrouridine(20/20a) synthase DusA n=1 Tax=Halioxenophilus sp. WMMB6 TaxID=3073815 RepID=UPI00295E6E58|nr:tRNA dihydrouridine(20/20a) synthase DusA [Halioxenophilus sp. WMMB6]
MTGNLPPRTFCVAPMMDYSDRHCRYLWRLLTRHSWLYTEMVTTGAILHGDRERFLKFNSEEHPVALQLGGSDPQALAECTRIAEQWGYDEVNLNCGCPSDRVQNGMIGAVLMQHPERVADCVAAMQAEVAIPVTVKHRIGIDDMEDYAGLLNFVDTVTQAGCQTFIVHARKAWLQGLSPKQNREVPPLRYELVYQLKRDRPDLEVIINGGITTLAECQHHLQQVDGVMLGREAYHNIGIVAEVDQALYGTTSAANPLSEVYEQYARYCQQQLEQGEKLGHMAKHLLGLFHGQPGARQYRRYLSEHIHQADAGVEALWAALALVTPSATPIASLGGR